MKWYIWVFIIGATFAAGYFTGDMVAKNIAKKLAAKKAVVPIKTVVSSGPVGGSTAVTG